MFTILHLSDLHRSPEEPVNNDSLIAALLADRDRYLGETPAVASPDAIVVSGDLVQGAPIGQAGWQQAVAAQYDVAGRFLDDLARRFLGGDRSKLIIIPGNHDICWNTSFAAMDQVAEADYPENVYRALTEPDTRYRWCWRRRALFRVRDQTLYARRLDAFWAFAESFYAGVALPLPIDRTRPFQLFELDQRRIIIAAFDSTSGNDCFGYSGSIVGGAVARCDLHLRDIDHAYKLRMAVWHHSLQGPPARDDYMDVGQVHEMAGLHFQLGMHGHQHVAAAATHYVYLGESRAMAVVSSGSLCAGSRELPRGVNRQYNVIAINDDYLGARVHVREMVEGSQFTRKTSGAFALGYVDVAWQVNTDLLGRQVDADAQNERRAVIEAEDALQRGEPGRALALLTGCNTAPGSHARTIAVQAALRAPDWPHLVRLTAEPQNAEEAILLVTALTKTDDIGRAAAVLKNRNDIDPTTQRELESQIETKKLLSPR